METVQKFESYQQLKARHQKESDDFKGIFFAYSNIQFAEGMVKVGLNPKRDINEIYSLGAGGYILKSRSSALHDMMTRHSKEHTQRNKDEKFLVNSIAYELANHEYCITGDITEALEALGLEQSELDPKVLKKAIDKHNEKSYN